MAKTKLLNNTEGIALVAGALMSLVMGGWNTVICAMLAGFLIGISANHEGGTKAITRAVVLGLIASVVCAVLGYVYNTWVTTLPGVDEQDKGHAGIYPLIVAAVLGTLTALYMAFVQTRASERARRIGLLSFLGVCAVLFPFFDQCPTLAWNSFSFATFVNPTVGCTTQKPLIWMFAMIVMIIYALQAMGLNIVAGYAGLLDLGYVAFFAIGAYTMGLLNSDQLVAQDYLWFKFGFWIVIWICAAMAAFFGLLLGAPTLPLRGDYLAIVTLGFGEIIPIVAKNLEEVRIFEPISLFFAQLTAQKIELTDRMGQFAEMANRAICFLGCKPNDPLDITAGTKGISPIDGPVLGFGNLSYKFVNGDYIPWYFLALALIVLSAFFIFRLRASRMGRAWVSMREDELAANAMGVDLVRTKLAAFIIGAMFSGFAGAFYGSYVSFIEPGSFAFDISVQVLAMVILGGTGNITGVLVGAAILKLLDLVVLERIKQFVNGITQGLIFKGIDNPGLLLYVNDVTDATAYKILIFGLILVVMMKVRPEGLIPAQTAKRK
jgi:branched-chain amino acid transport system permease protein